MSGEERRDESAPGGEGGHEHGDEPLLGAADDHAAGEAFAFMPHEVEVMGNHHDAVPCRDPPDGNEAYQGGDGDVIDHAPCQGEAAHEREGDVQHDLQSERHAAEIAEQQQQHHGHDETEEKENALGGFLL